MIIIHYQTVSLGEEFQKGFWFTICTNGGGGGSPVYKLLVSPDQTVDGSGNPGAGAQVDITALNFLVFIV